MRLLVTSLCSIALQANSQRTLSTESGNYFRQTIFKQKGVFYTFMLELQVLSKQRQKYKKLLNSHCTPLHRWVYVEESTSVSTPTS